MASDGEISCANDPNFAIIYSFLKVFGKLYGVEVPTLAKLQEFIENTQEVSEPLKELHLRLLRRALKSVLSSRWEKGLIKFCHQQGHHQEAWEIERFSYKKASTQVKLKVLKLLLEYQFTCHPKFKTAVNALSCKDLRLNPIGRDKNGCVYWLEVDDDANLCLYKEDQDEETWQLVARNREELVKVIAQLKSGEEICPLNNTSNVNEDSSSAEVPPEEPVKSEVEDENDEEFLSPESESEHETDDNKTDENLLKDRKVEDTTDIGNEDKNYKSTVVSDDTEVENIQGVSTSPRPESPKDANVAAESPKNLNTDSQIVASPKAESPINESVKCESPKSENAKGESPKSENVKGESPKPEIAKAESPIPKSLNPESPESNNPVPENPKTEDQTIENSISEVSEIKSPKDVIPTPETPQEKNNDDEKEHDVEVGETIEEPLMIVTGEGNGADCESFYLGEEIVEEVMYFYGEGSGYDNNTGNPEAIEQTNSSGEHSDEENGTEECMNGEHDVNSSSKTILGKSIKLKSSLPSVPKRSLKKQSNDTAEVLKPESKKHCIREVESPEVSNNLSTVNDNDLKRDASVNDKIITDSESPGKNNIKKSRGKVKKKVGIARKLKLKESNEVISSITETDNGHDNKSSFIEKRKSSVSSEEHEDSKTDADNQSPEKELTIEDSLPPKKLRLETTPESDVNVTHSKETANDSIENVKNDEPISQRKKIKASKGKFKRKNATDNSVNKTNSDNVKDSDKRELKALKRSLLDATMSDKNKTESQSDSEDDEPVTSSKRIKVKPKKSVKSSRKKVEEKHLEKHSSDESDEETLYSLAGKKLSRKPLKKPKSKDKKKMEKEKSGAHSEDDITPVRQSRRIAQMKIKEEAQRRHQEEVALRDLKMIHKKKGKDDEEEEWRASSSEGSSRWGAGGKGGGGAGAAARRWRGSASSGPETDSDSDEPLFDVPPEEPDLNFDKSDHEFSPESDLESGEPAEPMKRARTLQEGADEGFCKRCGSGEQPEWILLCDRCDDGYHASCLKPMLFLIPEGDWFCPQCNHEKLIESLERELTKYDELLERVEAERARKKEEEPEPESEEEPEKEEEDVKSESESCSSSWSSSSCGAVYRLRARKQLPVSYRAQEYDRLISTAIKEEYSEPTTSAGNQGRGKDISTIIEAAEEEKLKAEREAIEQGQPVEAKKLKKKQRRKPRKLNSLDVPSEDDDETDEDFKDTGMESSSEDISSSAERDSSGDSRSSDSLPIRRTCRSDKKERPKMTESSPEVKKKKKGVLEDSSSESADAKEWSSHKKSSHKRREKRSRGRSGKKRSKRSGLTQYDAAGNVIRARVTYGGLSDDPRDPNDWSPKHRTRQRKINYTEMPNTESEDEMHKSSGKHMGDSSDEFKVSESESSGSESSAARRRALSQLVRHTPVVPLHKLPDHVARQHMPQEHDDPQPADVTPDDAPADTHSDTETTPNARPTRGKGSRGGRGSRGGSGRGRGRRARAGGAADSTDDALAKLVGVKIKDLSQDPVKPNQADREKKRLEREAKLAEKEAKKLERIQKREEKVRLKEEKAKMREEKRLAKLALQESKRMKKEKPEPPLNVGYGIQVRPLAPDVQRMNMYGNAPIPIRHPGDYQDQRFPTTPRLQVRAELRGVMPPDERSHPAHPAHPAHPSHPAHPAALREGTLSVAGSPQPFKPVAEEPSIITRMPHMINQQYRGPMMYGGNSAYGARAPQNVMYPLHHAPRGQYPPPGYYSPAGYPPRPHPGHPTHPPHPPTSSPGPVRALAASPPAYRPGPGPAPRQLGPFGPQGPHGPRPPPPGVPGAGPAPPGVPPAVAHQPPGTSPPHSTPPAPGGPGEPLIRIKAEVKVEPEYRSPTSSPAPPSPGPAPHEPPRHPKIKHTENKDRRPRHPLGPYAPHYGPYGPYAPGPGPPPERLAMPTDRPRPPFGPPPYQIRRPPFPQYPPAPEPHAPERSRSPVPRLGIPERPPGPAEMRIAPPDGGYIGAQLRMPVRAPVPFQSAPPTRFPAPGPAVGPPVGPPVGPIAGPPVGPAVSPALGPVVAPPGGPSPGPAHAPPPGPILAPTSGPTLSSMPGTSLASTSVSSLGPAGGGPAGAGRSPSPGAFSPGARVTSPARVAAREFTSHAVQRLVGAAEVREEARGEGGVFGGLVSYFSSQHEADMDA